MPTRIKVTRTITHIIDVDTDDPEEAARRAVGCLDTPGMCPGCVSVGLRKEGVAATVIPADPEWRARLRAAGGDAYDGVNAVDYVDVMRGRDPELPLYAACGAALRVIGDEDLDRSGQLVIWLGDLERELDPWTPEMVREFIQFAEKVKRRVKR